MNPPAPTRTPARNTTANKLTEIAVGSKVVGEISGATGLNVHGEVEGKIHIDNEVVIGSSGSVHGEIRAQRVKVSGKVTGNVRGLESVAILAEGSLVGDVVSPRMSIADGAFFKGKVEMAGEPEPKRAPSPPSTPPPEASEGKP